MSKRLPPIPSSLILGVLTTILASCTTNDNIVVSPNSPTLTNRPVIVVAPDAFTFTVDAVDFSYNATQAVFFSGDSLVATYVVTNYSSGTSSLDVADANGTHVTVPQAFTGNVTLVSFGFSVITPTSITITLSRYTGKVSFVLARKK